MRFEFRMAPKVQIDKPKVFLKVPFDNKDEVKALGAWWDMPNKAWYIPHTLAKDPAALAKFAKWIPPPGTFLPTTTPAAKKAISVTPAAVATPALPSPELLQALGNKKDYTLITPTHNHNTATQTAGEAPSTNEVVPIPSFLLYKLQEKSTADLAKILVALGVKLPLGLDVEELIEVMQEHPHLIHIDLTPKPKETFKPQKELTEHELIMQRLKARKDAEDRERKRKEKGLDDAIKPEPGTGYVGKLKRPKIEKEKEEVSKERQAVLDRLEDDDYSTIR